MIKISNLSKSFSGQTVLDHLNLDIQKGEVVALIGSSGAGKSTFLRSLNYLETPDSGSIQIDDFNEAAYASETIRAAILSVNPGEIEAARSLGMTRAQVYRRVIIPNAAVVATPTLINSLIGLTKGTSLAFSAGVVEVFAQAQILGGADYRYFERFISVALVYWVVNIAIENLGRFIEKKMAIEAPDNAKTDVKGDLR